MKHEEVKQLKKGQTLYLPVTVTEVLDAGNRIAFSVSYASRDGRTMANISAYYEQLVLPSTAADKPKYDPCRLFKKGDRVRIVKYAGRCYTTFWEAFVGVEMYVETSETAYSLPEVETAKGLQPIDPAYLELVTPVEELKPYFLFEDTYSWQVKRENKLCCRFGKSTHPHAKEAAEAECARLNAEYRKEQNNGNK